MQTHSFPKFFIPAVLTIIAVWAFPLVGWLMHYRSASLSPAEIGQLGDMFGVINSLFSGLAILGAIYAIHQQIKDTRQQELRHQEEKDREERQFRRTKFEEVVLDLDSAYRTIIALQGEIGTKYLGGKGQAMELWSLIDAAFSRTKLLCHLYWRFAKLGG